MAHSGASSVELLLRHGASVDAQNKNGRTPLHEAVIGCQTDLIKVLQPAHANPIIVDKDGNSPLSFAIKTGFYTIVRMLLGDLDSNGLSYRFSKDQEDASTFLTPILQREAEMQEKEQANLKSYLSHFNRQK